MDFFPGKIDVVSTIEQYDNIVSYYSMASILDHILYDLRQARTK